MGKRKAGQGSEEGEEGGRKLGGRIGKALWIQRRRKCEHINMNIFSVDRAAFFFLPNNIFIMRSRFFTIKGNIQ